MDNAVYFPPFVRHVVESGAIDADPFVLIDVGCGMGIDPLWRVFEPHLVAHGLDPQEDEVARLAQEEANPSVHYHASLVGLPEEHAFLHRPETDTRRAYFEPIDRSSGFAAAAQQARSGRRSLEEMNSWRVERLATRKVGLTEFIREQHLGSVDFVKTDTDGGDYEVLLSGAEAIGDANVLGFMVETPLNAPPTDTAHAFHNIDLFLRRAGFLLFTMSVNRYSRAALPAPFVFRVLAQTTFGQVMWGDLVYLRDAGSPHYEEVWGSTLDPAKLLKIACLYALFGTPDVAVETLLRHRSRLQTAIDVDRGLDLLTPPLPGGRTVSYREYLAAFEADPYAFYPPQTAGTAIATGVRKGARTMRRVMRRAGSRIRY